MELPDIRALHMRLQAEAGPLLGRGSLGRVYKGRLQFSLVAISNGTPLKYVPAYFRGQVEVGPLLGRGSFGRVYKGRWNSSLVAIKVVDHLASGASDGKLAAQEQRIAREALLSTSLSHPSARTRPLVASPLLIIALHSTPTVLIPARAYGLAPASLVSDEYWSCTSQV